MIIVVRVPFSFAQVKGVEAMLEAMSMERSQALEVCNAKEETIEKLVNEYSHLSGEMRESGERDGETIAALEEEKEDLTSKLAVLEGHLRQVSESADLVQQITGQSTEEGIKQAQDLSAAKIQVSVSKELTFQDPFIFQRPILSLFKI